MHVDGTFDLIMSTCWKDWSRLTYFDTNLSTSFLLLVATSCDSVENVGGRVSCGCHGVHNSLDK